MAEVAGAMALKAALAQPWWFALTLAGYVTAFLLMALLLRWGNTIGVIYGIWAASGVALTAIAGAAFYGDALSGITVAGIAVVIAGVVLVESGNKGTEPAKQVSA